MSNLDELLGTAAQNPRAVEAATAIKEEMPACLREINNLMHPATNRRRSVYQL